MIVTEPNDFAAEIHDRMPLFLRDDQFAPWLSEEAGAEALRSAPNDYLQRWAVSNKQLRSDPADMAESDGRMDLAVNDPILDIALVNHLPH